MKKVKLGEVFKLIRNGATIKQFSDAKGIPITRIETISFGKVDYSKMGYANIYSDDFNSYYLQEEDILMSHINSLKHLGKTAIVKDVSMKIIHGMNLLLLRTEKKHLNSFYAKFYFESNRFYNNVLQIANQSVNQSSFSISKLKDLEIPLPPLPQQKAIAAQLDKAQELIQYNEQLIEKYDELQQSLFLDMFGDPILNEKGWEMDYLSKLGEFKNGLNYTIDDDGEKTKILGVGDFKNHRKLNNKSSFSEIIIKGKINENYYLKDNDLVFVRSNGNKDLVGRCVIVFPGEELITYSGFCIRFRTMLNNLNSTYLSFLFSLDKFKKNVFAISQGANIQNINQKMLSEIKVILPPLSLQTEFASHIESIELQKDQAKEALAKSKDIFQGLLQEHFSN